MLARPELVDHGVDGGYVGRKFVRWWKWWGMALSTASPLMYGAYEVDYTSPRQAQRRMWWYRWVVWPLYARRRWRKQMDQDMTALVHEFNQRPR